MSQLKWTTSDKYPGVRWFSDPERPKLSGGRHDRCFGIRYAVAGRRIEAILGWASESWTEQKASHARQKFIEAAKSGEAASPKEERESVERERRERVRRERHEAKRDVSFRNYFLEVFLPDAELRWKPETTRKSKEHVENWIHPVTGDTPIREIDVSHVQRFRLNLAKAGRSPRTQQYVMRTFTMVWNSALDNGIADRRCPTKAKSVRPPKLDNERQRYLTEEEADKLVACVRARSPQAADMALISLDTGLRFSEIAGLTWGCLDDAGGFLRILNTKSGRDRNVPMTTRAKGLFDNLARGADGALVFPNTLGQRHVQVPSSFKAGIVDAGLNDDAGDPKMRVSFHTLRHTYASRLVQQGVDLYRVQRLLGHSTPVLTARYAKLAADDLREAVESMERREQMRRKPGKVIQMAKGVDGHV